MMSLAFWIPVTTNLSDSLSPQRNLPGDVINSCDDRAVYWFYKEISEGVAYQ